MRHTSWPDNIPQAPLMNRFLFGWLFLVNSLVLVAAPRQWTFGDGATLRLNLPQGFECEQISPPGDTTNQAFTISYPDINAVSTITY